MADRGRRVAVWCCACGADVQARLTDGAEVYPHRPDLAALPFWRHDACGGHVGCHRGEAGTRPLGCIADAPMRAARRRIHAVLDPVWRDGRMSRSRCYASMSRALGREYHTAGLRTAAEAEAALRAAEALAAGGG